MRQTTTSHDSNREALFSAYEAISDAVLLVDSEMLIRAANSACGTLFSHQPDSLIGQSIDLLIPQALRCKHQQQASRYLEAPKLRMMNSGNRLSAATASGDEIPVSISLNPIHIDDQRMVLVVVRDLSELVKVEKKLLQKQKMESLGVVVGGVAHDINNIMTAIRGSIYLARRRPDAAIKHLDTIETQCNHAADIVQQMLICCRDESSERRCFRIDQSLNMSKRLLKASLPPEIKTTFSIRIDPDQALACGSPSLLNQAVINLVLNARDALNGSADATIEVCLERGSAPAGALHSRSHFKISVKDNGPGIPPHLRERIFEPFFTTKPSTKGTGLGLAIVYNVSESFSGCIELHSPKGGGTCFELYIPEAEQETDIPSCADATDKNNIAEGRELNVLLVEDHKQVRKVNRDIIESLGHNCLQAKNGVTAMKKAILFKDEIDLMIMDISMPKLDGISSALRLRGVGWDAPIIFVSADPGRLIELETLADQLYPFATMAKPFNIGMLDQQLQSLAAACENNH